MDRKPEVSHIQIFFSLVMTYVQREGKKAKKLFLVEYVDNIKDYR